MLTWNCIQFCTAKTLFWKFETHIPTNETAEPRSQFLNSCFCKPFTIGLPFLLQEKWWTDRGNIYIARRNMNVGTENDENEALQFHFWEYVSRIFFALWEPLLKQSSSPYRLFLKGQMRRRYNLICTCILYMQLFKRFLRVIWVFL